MAQTGSRTGAANLAAILAVVAFIAMGGLIYWLQVTAEPTQREVPVVEDTQEDEPPLLDVPIVGIDQIREEPTGYVDLELAIRNETINSFLGDAGVWIGPSDNPFLVKLDSTAQANAPELSVSDRVHVRGEIQAMSDSALDAWEAAGEISGEGDRAVASFSEYFLQASEIELARGSGGQGGGSAQDTAAAGSGGGGGN